MSLKALVVAAVVLAAAPASAQVLEQPTLYRLGPVSTFERGCFNPCDCPSGERVRVSGTFRLALVTVGNVFDFYEVTGVRWKVHRSNGEIIEITGSGTYAVSTIIDQQRLELTLTVGTDPPTVHRSGDVPGGAAFPKIVLPISINGGVCFDTVIAVDAKPARRLYVDRNDIRWDLDPERTSATSDVVMGDLAMLRGTSGAFDAATSACAAAANGIGWAPPPGDPPVGQGIWFLERESGDLYADGDSAQVGSPDPGIALSSGACP